MFSCVKEDLYFFYDFDCELTFQDATEKLGKDRIVITARLSFIVRACCWLWIVKNLLIADQSYLFFMRSEEIFLICSFWLAKVPVNDEFHMLYILNFYVYHTYFDLNTHF